MPDQPNPETTGGVRMWVAPEPKYPSLLVYVGSMVASMGSYLAILACLALAGIPTIAGAIIACPIGVAAAWAWCRYFYRRWQRQWDAWFAAEADRRSAERLARFDAHVASLRIFQDRPQG